MDAIRIHNFLNSEQDWELKQYTILSMLKSYRKNFNQSKLYPSLASLMHLSTVLKNILKNDNTVNLWLSKEIKSNSVKDDSIEIQSSDHSFSNINDINGLVNWALPLIESILTEGMVIYNFVYDSIYFSQLNSTGISKDSGYILVPDNKAGTINLLSYELVLFKGNLKPEKTLRTKMQRSFKKEMEESIRELKTELKIRHKMDNKLPIYYLDTELDFPFTETILPVAKRKLLNLL